MRRWLALCPGAKSTLFSIISFVSVSHVHTISSRFQCNSAYLPSGRWVPTLPSHYHGYQRKQSTWPWTTNYSCVFLCPGDDVDFHCIDCRLVSGSYVNTQVSSHVIFEFNKSASFSVRYKSSKHNSLWRSLCSSDNRFETISAQNIPMSNFSLRIRPTLCCPNWLPQLMLEHPNFGLSESHLAIYQATEIVSFVCVCRTMYSQNMWYLLLFHYKNGYTKTLQCYVITTLPVYFIKQNILRSLKFFSMITTVRPFIICFSTLSLPISYISFLCL